MQRKSLFDVFNNDSISRAVQSHVQHAKASNYRYPSILLKFRERRQVLQRKKIFNLSKCP